MRVKATEATVQQSNMEEGKYEKMALKTIYVELPRFMNAKRFL